MGNDRSLDSHHVQVKYGGYCNNQGQVTSKKLMQYGPNSNMSEPPHVKTNKVIVRPAKTQICLGIRPVWSESSLCAYWVAKDPSFLHADSEDSDQTGRIWVFAGRIATLFVLSRGCPSGILRTALGICKIHKIWLKVNGLCPENDKIWAFSALMVK